MRSPIDDFAYDSGTASPASCPALCRASTSCFFRASKTWMAGTSPAMTMWRVFGIILLRLDVGAADHLAPFFCFFDDDLAPLCRRERQRLAAEIGKLGFDAGVIEPDIHFSVELRDDVGGRAFRCAQSVAQTRLVAWHGLADRRNVRKCRRPLRGGHRERPHLAGSDQLRRTGERNEIDLHPAADQVRDRSPVG